MTSQGAEHERGKNEAKYKKESSEVQFCFSLLVDPQSPSGAHSYGTKDRGAVTELRTDREAFCTIKKAAGL